MATAYRRAAERPDRSPWAARSHWVTRATRITT